MITLTRKDEMELCYWKEADLEYHRARQSGYLWAFGCYRPPERVLDVGCGPLGGVLPLLPRARRRIGVDPLVREYRSRGWLPVDLGIEFVDAHFEEWQTDERFDAIFSTDAIDHGEMNFAIIRRFSELLLPGGRIYLHVNLRPSQRLNAVHDHALTLKQLDESLAGLHLNELKRDVLPVDFDGAFDCPTLMAVWERPR